jgi:hypothetical protein
LMTSRASSANGFSPLSGSRDSINPVRWNPAIPSRQCNRTWIRTGFRL